MVTAFIPIPDRIPTKWRGMDDAEATQFVTEAIALLNDSEMVTQFEQNVAQVGTWANEVDDAFDRVTRTFQDTVNVYGKDFPELSGFLTEWTGYNKRWVDALLLSRDVASEHVAILRRFEKVFLEMVLTIETDQDRLDTIVELEQFTDETHDNSDRMGRDFLDLKRDIDAFSGKLDKYVVDKGAELAEAAATLQSAILKLQGEISALDKQINDARTALAVCGGLLNPIGVITAGSLFAKYKAERKDKDNQLKAKQRELADVNRKQEALPYLQTEFATMKPDFTLICERLQSFAEIWASVRSQSIQFREHIEGGMDAATNKRFKLEVQLAQDACTPLKSGLEKYAQNLGGRLASKGL